VSVRRVVRISVWLMFSLLASFLVLCCVGEVRQRILVHRAGELLSDMHDLRLHQSTWADVQLLMSRWGQWGHYEGNCTPSDCFYVITLRDTLSTSDDNVAHWPTRVDVFLSLFRLLPRQWGGGLRQLQGTFLVQDGVIKRSGLVIDMTFSLFAKGAQPVCCGSELIISVVSRDSLVGTWEDEASFSLHPNYKVSRPGGCTFCLMGRVVFADSIPAEEAARLSDFQLSCATRWSSCLTLEQLDPAAREWHLYAPPWGEAPDREEKLLPLDHCTIPLYARARDAAEILTLEAAGNAIEQRTHDDGARDEILPVRILSVLKGSSAWPVGATDKAISRGEAVDGGVRGPVALVKGKQYVMFIDPDSEGSEKNMGFDPCGIAQYDDVTRKEIERGIALDDQLRGGEEWVSLGGFHRGVRNAWDR
jgi:hypothetical protein